MADFNDDLITERFNRAADHVTHLIAGLKQEQLLEIYAYYKQATTGPCNTPKPHFYEFQARAKWDAWHNLKNMTGADAKQHYVRIITELDPSFSTGEPVGKSDGWAVVSSLVNTDAVLKETDKTVFDFCKEDNLPQVRDCFRKNPKILCSKDQNGLGLIHWAADRGNLQILKFLVENKADLNMVDNEGQTALHYATSCDYLSCVECLVNAGADCNVCDNDGLRPVDLTTDSNVLKLLKQFM